MTESDFCASCATYISFTTATIESQQMDLFCQNITNVTTPSA